MRAQPVLTESYTLALGLPGGLAPALPGTVPSSPACPLLPPPPAADLSLAVP